MQRLTLPADSKAFARPAHPLLRFVATAIVEHRDVVLSIATAFAIQALLIVSGVSAARILGAEGRGHLAALVLIAAVIAQAGTLGLPLAATYYIAREPAARLTIGRRLLRLLLPLTAAMLALQAAITLVVFSGDSASVQEAAFVTCAALVGLVCNTFGLAILQGCGRFRAFNALRTVQLILYAAGALALLLAGSHSLPQVSAAWSAATLLAGGLVLAFAWRGLRGGGDPTPTPARDMLRFGVTGLVGHASPLESYRVDQIAVGIIAGPVGLGLYVAGLAFSNLPRFVAQSIGMVAYPRLAAAPSDASRQVLAFFLLTLAASGAIVLALQAAVGELLPLLLGHEFAGAVPLARVLLLSALLFGLRRVLSDCARGLGRPDLGSIAEATSWLVALPAVLVFGHLWGAQGVAWALVLGAGASVIVLGGLMIQQMRADKPRKRHSPSSGDASEDSARAGVLEA